MVCMETPLQTNGAIGSAPGHLDFSDWKKWATAWGYLLGSAAITAVLDKLLELVKLMDLSNVIITLPLGFEVQGTMVSLMAVNAASYLVVLWRRNNPARR